MAGGNVTTVTQLCIGLGISFVIHLYLLWRLRGLERRLAQGEVTVRLVKDPTQ
jgi:hypothetical protein